MPGQPRCPCVTTPGSSPPPLAVEARKAATEAGGSQVATVGRIVLTPGLTNVVPKEARDPHRPAQHRRGTL